MPDVTDRPGEPLLEAIKDELGRRDARLSQALLDALISLEQSDDLDPGLWGPGPSADEVLGATVKAHRLLRQAREAVLADSLTRVQAAEALGVGPQRVSSLVEGGQLVALEDGRQLCLPAWQFHPDTPKGRLDGIAEVAGAHAGGPVTLTQWAHHPNPALAGRTPAQALLEGEVDAVVAAARAGA